MFWITEQKLYKTGDSVVAVIPKNVRKNLDLKKGDFIKLGIENDRLFFEKTDRNEGKKVKKPSSS